MWPIGLYKRIYNLVNEINPSITSKILQHKKKIPIFDEYYNIEEQIHKILRPKVWLKSGAHIYIEHTEAMTVIDVNSGRFIGKKDHENNFWVPFTLVPNSVNAGLDERHGTNIQHFIDDGIMKVDFNILSRVNCENKLYYY